MGKLKEIAFEVGGGIWWDGQLYQCAGIIEARSMTGRDYWLAAWESRCPVCMEPFFVVTGTRGQRFSPNRRCPAHHKPGAPVRPKRRTA